MTDVFISYSRQDKEFVAALHSALSASKRDTWVDWENIPLTADWWQEIEHGIEAANTFVFVISPDSVISKVCNQEIDHAVKHNKRLVPIVRRDDLNMDLVNSALAKHNWLFFRETDDFNDAFQALLRAIDTDLEHVKSHTRLLVRAVEWENKSRDESFLLRGSDLNDATLWLAQCGEKDPRPTNLQTEFIQASKNAQEANRIILEAGQKARQMVRLGAGVMGVMLAISAISAILAQQRIQAANQEVQTARVELERTKQDATKQTLQAQAKQTAAERNVKQANQALTHARRDLVQVKQEVAQGILAAAQKVQLAETKATQAQQLAKQSEQIRQKAQAEAIAAQRAVDEKTATLSNLDNQLKQANYQINLSQQALAESIGDTPARIAEETKQTPAIIYASFVPIRGDGQIQKDDPLGILLVTANGQQKRLQIAEATREAVNKTALEFRQQISRPNSNGRSYLRPAQQLYKWLIKDLEPELKKQKTTNLVFLLDASLRSLPLSAIYDGQQFLVERYSIGLMPGFSLTDTRPTNLKTTPVLAMGISESIGDLAPLPGVSLELSQIMQLRQGKQFLNQESTLANLKAQLQKQPYKILHLATHAEFRPGVPEKSYIQLWDTKVRMDQVDELGFDNYPIDLLVLSSCRTAIGDGKTKFGFAGMAIHAGVRAVLASLWYVNDEATTALMTSFYQQLKTASTKSEALREAQLQMLKGKIKPPKASTTRGYGVILKEQPTSRNYSHPYFWAAFTMIGNPW